MRYSRTLLVLMVMASRDAAAQAGPITADPDSASIRELITLEYHLSDLLNRGDWQAYAPHVADDYRQTTRRGEVRTKREVLMALQRRDSANLETVLPDSIEVRVYGDTGVLTAILTGRRATDQTVTFRSRILKTFVRREDRWYLVAMQGTAIPQGDASPNGHDGSLVPCGGRRTAVVADHVRRIE